MWVLNSIINVAKMSTETLLSKIPTKDGNLAPSTPTQQALGLKRRDNPPCPLLEIDDSVLSRILSQQDLIPHSLAACGPVCRRLHHVVATQCESRWKEFFADRWELTSIQFNAMKLAGSWMKLFSARYMAELCAQPWSRPSRYEVDACIQAFIHPTKETTEQICVVFLVDGSGSVTDDDFHVMRNFISLAVETISQGTDKDMLYAIIQFSNECRVELPPCPTTPDEISDILETVQRMNGGTNITAAIRSAGQLMKPLQANTKRVVALLTDGRVDSYQAREASSMAQRLVDEQGDVSLYAFGVGRGVDRQELAKIIGGEDPEGRILGLCTLYEAPW